MSREIKFKFIWSNPTKTNFLTEIFTLDQIERGEQFMVLENEPLLKNYRIVEILKWTGLKDENGKEIYEGDIVSIEHIYYEGIAQYNPKLKESFRKIGNYVCKYDEGRFVFGNGCNNLEIYNFWKWSQEKEFYYAIGDFVKENDRFGHFSKEYFRFLALEGNIFENPELLEE